MSNQSIQLLIVDDHTLVRKGLKALLQEYEGINVIGEAASGVKAIELVQRLKPDVVLIDLLLPVMDGIEAIKRMIAIRPDQRIIVLTAYMGDDKLSESIRAGAQGYLLKTVHSDELVQSIRNVYEGEPSLNQTITWGFLRKISGAGSALQPREKLSEREIEVLRLMTQGKTNQEIAEQLVLTETTIRSHISRILAKLGVQNRVQAALYSIQSGLVSLDETNVMSEVCKLS